MIHRYLELPPVTKSLETLLDHLGCLYKFHGELNILLRVQNLKTTAIREKLLRQKYQKFVFINISNNVMQRFVYLFAFFFLFLWEAILT